ncbi:MAG TPA: class I SAM-dependent methyltransferase [Geminicoccaceae bacterium]|nr:class I SAM-dependent methyltransferase [Geminicoccaceae bacterium]
MGLSDPDWRSANRANWNERVAIHLGAAGYEVDSLRAGRGRLHPIEEAEIGPLGGVRVLHLQCHFGRDSLILASRGASVLGLDFSPPAIAAARALAAELGLAERARFVEADLYDAPRAIGEPAAFDLVFATWGTINWLPDIRGWAGIVAHFLRPGGALYLAEGHPAALVLDDAAPRENTMPGWFAPYFSDGPLVLDDPRDYADPTARLTHARTYEWLHPLGAIVTALIDAGLTLCWLHEHDAVPWRMFELLVKEPDGMYRWPERPWLPLSFSLRAERRV